MGTGQNNCQMNIFIRLNINMENELFHQKIIFFIIHKVN